MCFLTMPSVKITPNIWKFLECLLMEQASTEVALLAHQQILVTVVIYRSRQDNKNYVPVRKRLHRLL